MSLYSRIKDRIQGKVPAGSQRSDRWEHFRAIHLERWPRCSVCAGTESLEVHHIKPFHLFPNLELDPRNLITLCESKKNGVNCHLFIGHKGNFKKINPSVINDARMFLHRYFGDNK